MIYLHVAMAVLASWRLTELMTQDRITQPIRTKLNTYLWSCPRCMSVWTGAWVTLVFALGQRWPLLLWLNWPFGIAWLYLVKLDWLVGRRVAQRGRELKVVVQPNGQWQFQSELSPPETANIVGMLARQFQPVESAPVVQANGEAK